MPIVDSASKVPADVFDIEMRDGKHYYGKELEDLRKKDRQEAAKKQLEKDESFKGKASAVLEDVASAARKAQGVSEPSLGSATDARKRRVEGAKKEIGMKSGGKVKSASARADGCAQRGKTRGKMI